ncbi:hypothetical protein BCR33DRAFT_417496 [Rhizoclosmatium globosum]|uniref:Uncharacterized protein n=1 Tax=Rhizoclosmatium globosum TaxID=329046 RepID=A0A1Y2BWE2_9FUNG|nr:hypothetical protein BCR33DRAFT_417496 [Rhizoclosmatium globosum]|eukprot:ORY39076.1 hypothetical protein BCR33DRAFT_417496 [Rhizoclosmatium globosum]
MLRRRQLQRRLLQRSQRLLFQKRSPRQRRPLFPKPNQLPKRLQRSQLSPLLLKRKLQKSRKLPRRRRLLPREQLHLEAKLRRRRRMLQRRLLLQKKPLLHQKSSSFSKKSASDH